MEAKAKGIIRNTDRGDVPSVPVYTYCPLMPELSWESILHLEMPKPDFRPASNCRDISLVGSGTISKIRLLFNNDKMSTYERRPDFFYISCVLSSTLHLNVKSYFYLNPAFS
jgi:hypothetical protein